ncbi:MAG: ATP synthase F1 subunit gamma [Nannocystaceae bacterium]|nr:ATP synthase F1 subunit gamma [Nannocystaceae bacterium]
MANLKELRIRIGSVKNTRKITAAMAQIAAARLRKAQNAVTAARPYGERMAEVMAHLVAGIQENDRAAAHPLLGAREVKSVSIIALTADRGLCGGFNSGINRGVQRMLVTEREAGRKVELTVVGKKASAYFRHFEEDTKGREHLAPTLDTVVELSKTLAAAAAESFLDGRVDKVILVYNKFVSVLTQDVTPEPLVPLVPDDTVTDSLEPTFEPNRDAILDHLVPVAIESQLQQAMFNSIASEIAARRVAMDAATDNAGELIADLTLVYNRERQAAITTELMEIIGGSEALKG